MGVVVSFFKRLFKATPNPFNTTNNEIQKHHEIGIQASPLKEQAGTDLANTEKLEEEPLEKQSEARESEADIEKGQEVSKFATEQVSRNAEREGQKREGLETQEKKEVKTEAEAKRITAELKPVMLDVEEGHPETNTGALTEEQEAEAWTVVDTHLEQVMELVTFYQEGLEGGVQPEVWPTEEEFQLAKQKIQYDPEKIHFAVCGSSGSGKSSLVNAFRGLKNDSPHAARTGTVETTKDITRYPDPQQEMPYNRLVWFDCPGAGTLKVPGWQYFNQQGLFIFDVIVLVYDTRFTEIDVSIIRNCELFKIPLFIVRSKADTHIQNNMKDLGYDEDDDDAEVKYKEYQEKARQLLIDKTKQNVKENLQEAGLAMHDVFIVSSGVIYSLVTMKPKKKTTPPTIDEARLVMSILKTAYKRRYSTHAAARSWAIISRGKNTTTALSLKFKQAITHHLSEADRFKKNMVAFVGDQFSEEEPEQNTNPLPGIWPSGPSRVKNII